MYRQSPINYIVKPNDTLYLIAKKYNTTIKSIMLLNNLTTTTLNIGQSLKIPLYTEAIVKVNSANIRKGPGLNYHIIIQMRRNSRLPIIAISNGWYKVSLFDGSTGFISNTVSDIVVHDGSKPITNILGFYLLEEGPALPSSYESFISNTSFISQISLFLFRLNRNNPTEIEKFVEFTDSYVENLVSISHANNVKVLGVIHNLLYKNGGTTVSKNLVKEMVSTKENRQTFINNTITLIEKYGFDGINIDIEDVYIEDSKNLSLFFTELGVALKSKGYYFSASVPSRISDEPFNPFSDPFDYAVIGKAVDEFVAMLYNEHGWPGSGPGPVVSIGWMERVLKYTLTKMPAYKVMAAVSVFGFDFNLTTGRNTYVTYQMAMNLASKYNKQVIFDETTQTPTFAYEDENGNKHEVWFENAQSIESKVQLAWSLGIKGVALWRLGMEDPAIWPMLRYDAVVRK